MSKLYIANTTTQHYSFVYRLPENDKLQTKLIPFGTQVTLAQENLTAAEIDFVVKQHTGDTHEYIVNAKSVDRAKGHMGLIYSIDTPVDAELIARTIADNGSILDVEAKKMREEATIAADKKMNDDNIPAATFSTEVSEQVNGNTNIAEAVAQGVKVDGRRKKAF